MRRSWRKLERRTMLVNLRNGAAIRGVLLDARGGLLQLTNAVFLEPGAKEPANIDGTAAVDVAQVAWVQLFTPSEP